MPHLSATSLFAADGLLLRHVTCDGMDSPRPVEEGNDGSRVILVLRGRFAFDAATVHAVASPARGLFLRDQQTYRIRHIDGEGDVCLALQGDLCRTLVASGPTARRLSTEGYLRIRALAVRLAAREPCDRLEVEETLCGALEPACASAPHVRPRDRDIAHAIAYEIERRLEVRLTLADLAAKAGVSVFHACRVFRHVMGLSIHRYHQEVRLGHALALLVETDREIARIAVDLGFANQGHLTNLFRRRYGVTPGRARKAGLDS